MATYVSSHNTDKVQVKVTAYGGGTEGYHEFVALSITFVDQWGQTMNIQAYGDGHEKAFEMFRLMGSEILTATIVAEGEIESKKRETANA